MTHLTDIKTKDRQLIERLEKAENEVVLSAKDITFLLGLKKQSQRELLFQTARKLRHRYFGNNIFLYGFIYMSTFCKNDCFFCYYRKSNTIGRRYRKTGREILSTAEKMAETGVHLIDLTMGEDPLLSKNGDIPGHRLCNIVKTVADRTGLPIMLSPGLIPANLLSDLKACGTTWYACYQETHNSRLFKTLRPHQNFNNRLEIKSEAHKQGLLIEDGILCGVGEDPADIACSIEVMKALDADQVRVMKFIPQKGTPMENRPSPDPRLDNLVIGILRLVFPNRLIPASLDVDGIDGLKNRLDAGANVVTSIVLPGQGLSGVARHSLDIEDGNRTSQAVLRTLNQWGLELASRDDYNRFIMQRQEAILHPVSDRSDMCD
jgi:methylornithine synthase